MKKYLFLLLICPLLCITSVKATQENAIHLCSDDEFLSGNDNESCYNSLGILNMINTCDPGEILAWNGSMWECTVSMTNTDEKVKISSASTNADYIGTTSANGVIRTNNTLNYINSGDYITLSVNVSEVDTNTNAFTQCDNWEVYLGNGTCQDLLPFDHTAEGYLKSVNLGTAVVDTNSRSITSSAGTNVTVPVVTTTVAGFMSHTDKIKLNSIEAGAEVNDPTNLAQGTRTATTVPITSSTGTNATLQAATTSLAGVMTAADKQKLDGLNAGAEANVQSDWNQTTSTADDFIKNKPTLNITDWDTAFSWGDHSAEGYLKSVNLGTAVVDTNSRSITSSAGTNVTVPVVTTTVAGFMSHTDKIKLDGIEAGAEVNDPTNLAQGTRTATTVPITSSTGTNATLQAATTSLAGVMTASDKTKLDGLNPGAEANVQSDWNQTTSTADDFIKNKPSFTGWDTNASDDFSGSWNDLSDIPAGFNDNIDHVDDSVSGSELDGTFPTGTGLLKRTGTGTYTIDTTSYLSSLTGNESVFSGWDKDASDDFDGTWLSLSGKPSIAYTTNSVPWVDLTGIPADIADGDDGEDNVQSDWNQTTTSADDFIKNKPPLNITDWDTAFSWGNHSTEGYLKSYTESDTLDNVTDRGATTTNSINTGGYTEGGSNTLSNDISGNAATATALETNGSNCSTGQFATGVDASGNAEGCSTPAPSGGNITLACSCTGLSDEGNLCFGDPDATGENRFQGCKEDPDNAGTYKWFALDTFGS